MRTATARKLKPFVNMASLLTVLVTLSLFVAAAFSKGFTEELLLEAAVFLISVKLVIGNYKTHMELAAIRTELAELRVAAGNGRANRSDV